MDPLDKLHFPSLADKEYRERLPVLQKQLSRLQIGLFFLQKRAVVVLEGSDAAGKGGAIRRMIRNMDPRGYRVYPIGPPTETEAVRHYLQRFWKRIPRAGQLAIFDRSWYGRVLVERVDKLATKQEWQRAYREINDFERLLVDDSVIIVKIFLHITQEEQRKRFLSRLHNPHKQWKLNADDLRAFRHADQYIDAFNDMLEKTATDHAPWKIIPANDKKFARTTALETVIDELSKSINVDKIDYSDPVITQAAIELLSAN